MNDIELGILIGITAPIVMAILLVIMLWIIDWFHDINYAKERIKELEEKIDFEKLKKVYRKRSDKE